MDSTPSATFRRLKDKGYTDILFRLIRVDIEARISKMMPAISANFEASLTPIEKARFLARSEQDYTKYPEFVAIKDELVDDLMIALQRHYGRECKEND